MLLGLMNSHEAVNVTNSQQKTYDMMLFKDTNLDQHSTTLIVKKIL